MLSGLSDRLIPEQVSAQGSGWVEWSGRSRILRDWEVRLISVSGRSWRYLSDLMVGDLFCSLLLVFQLYNLTKSEIMTKNHAFIFLLENPIKLVSNRQNKTHCQNLDYKGH